jgi:hypothetical protein
MAKSSSANAKAPAKKTPNKGRSAMGARSKSSHTPKAKPAAKALPRPKAKAKPVKRASAKALQPKGDAVSLVAAPPRGRGRPKDSPDVWTAEHVAEVADAMWAYVEATDCPSLPEFCYKNCVHRRRIYEFEELLAVKDYLHAKRAAYLDKAGISLTREDGPRGAFIIRALANVGDHSMTEKTETTEHVDSVNVYLPDNRRGDGPAPRGEHA